VRKFRDLDAAVFQAYGFSKKENVLDALVALNEAVVGIECTMQKVVGPGLPPAGKKLSGLVTPDCLSLE
jgi:hypothetical protein